MEINLNINGRTQSIIPDRVPTPSSSTIQILKNLSYKTPDTYENLQGRCKTLEATCASLDSAKSSSTKDKILSVLATTLSISILVASIATLVIGAANPITIGVGTGGLVAYLLISYLYNSLYTNHKNESLIKACGPFRPLMTAFVGPLIPIVQSFTKIPSLNSSVAKQEKEISHDMQTVVDFYTTNQKEIIQKVNEELQKNRDSLIQVRALPIQTLEGENEYKRNIGLLSIAKRELEAHSRFYAKLA